MFNTFTMDLAGRTLRVDVNRVGKQANGCALIQYGETTVLSTVSSKTPNPNQSKLFLYCLLTDSSVISSFAPRDSLTKNS